jgi:release factor glutamine methyltransferase
MDATQWKQKALASLVPLYGEREGANMIRWLFEDFGFSEQIFSTVQLQKAEDALIRLLAGEPLQYITGLAWFCGLKFKVTPDVLIPRPETEELIYIIKEHLKSDFNRSLKVLDIGTGSGCMAISLKHFFPEWSVTAIDFSEAALKIAQLNADQNGKAIDFLKLNYLDIAQQILIQGPWDLIVSNPPYIPNSEASQLAPNVLDHEPHMALFTSDTDGMEFYLAISEFAQIHLAQSGHVFLEIHEERAPDVSKLFTNRGFSSRILNDLQGKNRFALISREGKPI